MDLYQRYHVPIGLIESDYGGTLAEAWVSRAGLHEFAEFRPAIDSLPEQVNSAAWFRRLPPTPLFNAMIHPLTRYRIKGVIWYQGESNADENRDNYGYVRGFQIAGVDGKYVWAHARVDGQEMLVSSEQIPAPRSVRYGWANMPDGNVFSKEGLPALPFRTDFPGSDASVSW